MSEQPDIARRLFPQIAERRALQEDVPNPPEPALCPAPYKDAQEHAAWTARLEALRELAEPLQYALLDPDAERVKATVAHFLDGMNCLHNCPSLLAPSLAVEMEAMERRQTVRDLLRLTPAERRFWAVAWTVIALLIALLVFRNWPGVRDWEVWQ